uniref:RHS repeat domain-containing protein n=1 Tax=uncultured Sphingomonas sp. TaxID=158754 RepID=UPI0035CB0425
MRLVQAAMVSLALFGPIAASANDTITYSYNAKGRLITASHAGSANKGLVSTYQYDPADNRTSDTVSGGMPLIIVVPLNDITIIPFSA